ncbi:MULTISPECIES: 4a-hydroxytetrahydrobiopterin dehydratase [unclassified Janthinobacterium]|uniref:4a-hydroxytetrahydrobiopterin dehydratase n=1 Tax=unclassified Janthinobacterium TaxID=2610881 RepID=UPI00034DFE00|nr:MULTISPECIES: 4a-hydroxytetrahydrobiopterin dehydratase [unclassified Janthinobacterium]MEC5163072.1 4a-hydroxytetrahydrobiopterin dehydratase [Janthinobacterium sp. CG_S6]
MTNTTNDTAALSAQHCAPRQHALDQGAVARLLPLVPGWAVEHGKLCQSFAFRNYYQTLAFVNALAYMTHAQDHHPELTVSYNSCVARYATHSVNDGKGGLSENDFICAAKADALYRATAHSAAVAA